MCSIGQVVLYAVMNLQAILATAKSEAPPLFKLLASNFRKRDIAFGWFSRDLDPTVAEQLSVPRVPYLMAAYVDPAAMADGQGKVPMGIEGFNAPLEYKNMANFIDAVIKRVGRGEDQVNTATAGFTCCTLS